MNRTSVFRRFGVSISLLCLAFGTASCGVPQTPWFQTRVDSTATKPVPQKPVEKDSRTSSVQPVLRLPASYRLNVPVQAQLPQLKNGCEATSVAMLLTAVHHPMSKMTVARMEPKDKTPIVYGEDDAIVSWGNPNVGFVGSVQESPGFGIYHGPMAKLVNQILPGRAVDLTNHPFEDVLTSISRGVPVVVWTTSTFRPTNDWVTWQSPEGPVRVTFWEHAVLVVGYTPSTIIINDPLDGTKDKSVNRTLFIQAWKQLGRQALTVRP